MSPELESDGEEVRPWAVGVSPAQQAQAQALYVAGNALLYDFLLAEAVDRYREALRHWKHPGIHYNLARALYYLGRPLEAYESIIKALRYGPDALQPREHAQALDFKAQLEQRLAWLEVRCDQPDMEITLDGQPLLAGPGAARRYLLPGEHLLVATRPGAQPVSRRLRLDAGEHSTLALWSRQRWPTWQPWTVLGAGAGVGLTGALLQWRASANIDRFRTEFASQCPDGCTDSAVPELSALHTRAVWQNRVGVSALIAGGAAALGGAIMVGINRSQSIRVRSTGPTRERARLTIAPALSPGSVGAVATLVF